jgi:hypothetical protein
MNAQRNLLHWIEVLSLFGIKPNNCLTNVSKAIRRDLLQWKMGPKFAWEGPCPLWCRIVDPPTGIRSRADPYESNYFRWTVKARSKREVNKIRSKEFLDVQTKTSFWSILLRRKPEGTLPSCSCTCILRFFISLLRDNLFHGFLTLEYRALSFPFLSCPLTLI